MGCLHALQRVAGTDRKPIRWTCGRAFEAKAIAIRSATAHNLALIDRQRLRHAARERERSCRPSWPGARRGWHAGQLAHICPRTNGDEHVVPRGGGTAAAQIRPCQQGASACTYARGANAASRDVKVNSVTWRRSLADDLAHILGLARAHAHREGNSVSGARTCFTFDRAAT
eukprot:6527074-Prymnesium_polylepis.1